MFCHFTDPLSLVTKMLFQLVLLIIFVYFFGIPSVKRYINQEVLTVVTVIRPEEVLLPAVTIWAMDPAASGLENIDEMCGESGDIKACIKERTPSLSATVHAELGLGLRQSLMAPHHWREDFIALLGLGLGHSYTLVYPQLRGNNWLSDDINLHVNTSDGFSRRIFIHDPDYFVLNMNPLALPNKMLTLTQLPGRVYYSLAIKEHRKLDTQNDPCVEEPGYSFTTCVKESLSRKTGCRPPWDTLSDQGRAECTTLQQYRNFTRVYENIVLASMSVIINKTGCNKPCRYREYVVVEGPVESVMEAYSYFSVDLWLSSTDITILTDIPVYPWTSLIAEFGGTFSLFFGLSMMTLWDGVEKLAKIIKHW